MFLEQYLRKFSSRGFYGYSVQTYGIPLIFVSVVLLTPLLRFLPRRYWFLIPLFSLLVYSSMKTQAEKTFILQDGGQTLIVQSPQNGKKIPIHVFMDITGAVLMRVLGLTTDPLFPEIKNLGSHLMTECCSELRFRVYSPHPIFPRRQIVITNHTHSPVRDSFSFFPLIPPGSKILVVQHEFNKIVSMVSKRGWGAWTINKDDKTPEGKTKLNRQLQEMIDYMNREPDLTVVIYPQGRVPRTVEECRQTKTFYPGAFYMSLMTRYPVTTLINDYSQEGVFSLNVKKPVDVYEEYKHRIVDLPEVGAFRTHPQNKEVLDEICERFRNLYQAEYDWITKTENGRADC